MCVCVCGKHKKIATCVYVTTRNRCPSSPGRCGVCKKPGFSRTHWSEVSACFVCSLPVQLQLLLLHVNGWQSLLRNQTGARTHIFSTCKTFSSSFFSLLFFFLHLILNHTIDSLIASCNSLCSHKKHIRVHTQTATNTHLHTHTQVSLALTDCHPIMWPK